MKRVISFFIILVLVMSLFIGCSPKTPVEVEKGETSEQTTKKEEAPEQTTKKEKTPEQTTKKIVDMMGNEVEIPAEVKTVVNLWPSSNEVMICLGAGDLIIGTMEFVKKLPWVNTVYPKIKDVPVMDANAEELLKVNPDVIITASPDDTERLINAGLNAINLMFNDYDSMKKSVTILGEVLGGEYKVKADKLIEYVNKNISLTEETFKDLEDKDKPVVYYIQGQANNGIYSTTGAGTIMEQWVNYGGGKYATSDLGKGMQIKDVTPEQILKTNPDIVVIGGPAQHDLYDELMKASEWQEIKAIKNKRVYKIPNGCFPWDRFGAESAMQILWAATTFHPELINIDMVNEVKTFYKDFAEFDMTDEQAKNMLMGRGPAGE
jgi:iron complex transport system substrate-binding protein